MSRAVALLSTFLPLIALGCEDFGLPFGGGGEEPVAEEEPSTDFDPDDYEAEPGSCNAWKISYCHAIDQCSAFGSSEDCMTDVAYLRCLEDTPFGECQEQIDQALEDKKCEDLPEECTPANLADRTIPMAQCAAIYESICEFNFYCGIESSVESCVSAMNLSAPCSEFTAAWPGAEVCPDLIDMMSCGDSMPNDCVGVLRR